MFYSGIDYLNSLENWQALYDKLPVPAKSPYFSPNYYNAYMKVEKHRVECYWAYKDDNNFLFYPYLKRSINALGYDLDSVYYDISGAYGYNGPIGCSNSDGFIEEYNRMLQQYLIESKVVSEFVRYCPITGNRRYHTYTDQINVLDNVFIDLSKGLDFVWEESFEYRVRKTIRKGESYELQSSFYRGSEISDENIYSFVEIYNSTMQRNSADSFYFFDHSFFHSMVKNMGSMLLLSITYFKDIPISSELILLGPKIAYGFLGGTLREYYKYKANTFQRWELLKYLSQIGINKYSMGGGASRGDSIFEFKMSFAIGCKNPFYIGTKIHDAKIYREVITNWEKKVPLNVRLNDNKLQRYRNMRFDAI